MARPAADDHGRPRRAERRHRRHGPGRRRPDEGGAHAQRHVHRRCRPARQHHPHDPADRGDHRPAPRERSPPLVVARSITRPLQRLQQSMLRLAENPAGGGVSDARPQRRARRHGPGGQLLRRRDRRPRARAARRGAAGPTPRSADLRSAPRRSSSRPRSSPRSASSWPASRTRSTRPSASRSPPRRRWSEEAHGFATDGAAASSSCARSCVPSPTA